MGIVSEAGILRYGKPYKTASRLIEVERGEYVVTGGCVVMMPRPITGRGFLYQRNITW